MSSEGLPVNNVVGTSVDLGARSVQGAANAASSSLNADSAAESADRAWKFSNIAASNSEVAAGAVDESKAAAERSAQYSDVSQAAAEEARLAASTAAAEAAAQAGEAAQQAIEEAIRQSGYTPVDSFEAGATLELVSSALRWIANNNAFYSWRGSFPKVVPPGSTPETSGGFAPDAWIDVSDSTFRTEAAQPDGPKLIGRMSRTLNDWLNDFTNLADFIDSNKTMEQCWSDAIAFINSRGGGRLIIPARYYKFTGTVESAITTPIVFDFSAGSRLDQSVDSDNFKLLFSSNGSLHITGEADATCSFDGKSYASAIFKLYGSGNLRDIVFGGKFRYRPKSGSSQFKYGTYLIGIQEPDLSGMLIYGANARADDWITACYMTNGVNQASTAGKFWGPSAYRVLYGLVVESTQRPGVEGLRIMSGDFVSCKHGLVIDNSAAGYIPPQFEVVHCHINSYGANMVFKKCVGVNISGGLYYRYDSTSTDEHVIFESCQGIDVTGGAYMQNNDSNGTHVNNPVLRFKGTTDAPVAIASVSGCKFWTNADNANSPIVLEGVISQFQLGDGNIKTTASKWINTDALTTGLSTINKSATLQSDAGEPTTYTAKVINGVLDVRDSLLPIIILSGVDSSTVITSILGRRGWVYDIRSDTAGVSISPGAYIQFAGISSNVPFSVAGCIMRFHMSSFNVARFLGSSVSQTVRSPALPVQAPAYATGSLPSAAANSAGIIFVTGISTFRIPAYSDGTAWRKFADDVVIT